MPLDLNNLRDADGNPYVPQTFDEAVDFLYRSMDENEKDNVRENGARRLHFSLGMTLRNEWNLWETGGEEPLVRDTIKRFKCFPGDDVSDHILMALEERVGYAGARVVNGAGQQARSSNAQEGSIPSPRATFMQTLSGLFKQRF